MSDDGCSGTGGEEREHPGEILPEEWSQTAQLDTVFSILSDRRRRYLLYFLFEMSGRTAEFSQLVETIRYCEAGNSEVAEVPEEDDVVVDLHHNQFPRLEEAGIIEYGLRHGTVRYEESPVIEEWLEHAFYKETGDVV